MIALMYHDVVAAGNEDQSGFPGPSAASYKVTPERFGQHLHAIHPEPSSTDLVITFDDGGASASEAADILEAHEMRGCFLVATNFIGTSGFVTGTVLRDLHERGHLIGSHSCSHPFRMGHCPRALLDNEWQRSCAVLADHLGESIHVASIPGGDYSPVVAEAAAEAGIKTLFTSEPTARAFRVGGTLVRGRFTIRSWTSARTAAALASGRPLAHASQALSWNVRKAIKEVGGNAYLEVRRRIMGDAKPMAS